MAVITDHPGPIDPSYQPKTSITSIRATAPIEEILSVLERDGGVILTNFASPDDIRAIEEEIEPYRSETKTTENSALSIIPKETLSVTGLVGKSSTVARLCESTVLENLRRHILRDKFIVVREGQVTEKTIDPLLSISLTFHIGPGAPRQWVHRDDNIHGVSHGAKFDLKKASQFACLIAGTRTTRQNGATMFIPGSHKWDDTRVPKTDEVCFAEMEPGSALVFLGSAYHGGGHNSTVDEVRKVHGLFFVRGILRTEENQFLAVPRSKVLDMTDKMLALLGYKKPPTALGIVDNHDPAMYLEEVLEKANR